MKKFTDTLITLTNLTKFCVQTVNAKGYITIAEILEYLNLGTAAGLNTGTTQGTIPLIGEGDKLPASIIPTLDLTDTILVEDEAERLALSLEDAQSKIVVQADNGTSWGLVQGGDPAILDDWLQVGDRAITSLDVTDATPNATPNKIALRGENGEAAFGSSDNGFSGNGVQSYSGSGNAFYGSSASGVGILGTSGGAGAAVKGVSGMGPGMSAMSDGERVAEFGNDIYGNYLGDDRSFVQKLLGLFGWFRGNYKQTFGAPNTLSQDSDIRLPDVASGTVALVESSVQTSGNQTVGGVKTFTSGATNETPLIVKGFLGQTANLQVWINSAESVLAFIDGIDGSMAIGGPALTKTGDGTTLQINSSNNYATLRLVSNTADWGFFTASTGAFLFRNTTWAGFTDPFVVEAGAPNDSLIVKTSGNVGIGTTNPTAPLEVNGHAIFAPSTGPILLGGFSGYGLLWAGQTVASATIDNPVLASNTVLTLIKADAAIYMRVDGVDTMTFSTTNATVGTGKAIAFSSNSGTWNGAVIAGPQTFSSASRPKSAGTGTPASDDLIMLEDARNFDPYFGVANAPSANVGFMPLLANRFDSDHVYGWGDNNSPGIMYPFMVRGGAFNKVSINHTGGTHASAVMEIAIYLPDSSGKPHTLLEQGTVSLTATGIKTLTLAASHQVNGLFFVCIRPSIGTIEWAATGGVGNLSIMGSIPTCPLSHVLFGSVDPTNFTYYHGNLLPFYNSYTHPFPATLPAYGGELYLYTTTNSVYPIPIVHA